MKVPLMARSPFLEMEGLMLEKMIEGMKALGAEKGIDMDFMIDSVKFAANLPSPRVIKTHLPFEFLPPKLLDTCKVIYVGRNPKDVCVSFYHMHNNSEDHQLQDNFDGFANLFLQEATMFGSYWNMLKSAW